VTTSLGEGCGCRLCTPDDDRARWDRFDRASIERILSYGWTVIGIPAEDDNPASWVFTTGLLHGANSPELVVCGLPVEVGMEILNVVGQRARQGRPPRPDERSAEVLEGAPVTFRPVHLSWYGTLLGWMTWFYRYRRQPVPVLQVVWPDKQGRFPWDTGFDGRYRDDQPELWRPAGEQPAGPWRQLQEIVERPFGLPGDAGVMTTRPILEGVMPVLRVVRDDDGDWQFLDGEPTAAEDGVVTHLQHLIERDRSIMAVADLPCGWQAWRSDATAPWQSQPCLDPSDAGGGEPEPSPA
jgi:Domain of unknown function (DUF4262)